MNSGLEQTKTPNSTAWFMRILLGARPKWTLVRILLLIIASVVIFGVILIPIKVVGRSMEPTLYDGQVRFVNRFAYNWTQPKRGDLIAFKVEERKEIILKRIIGMPGERIAFHTGVVFINGQRLEEPYLPSLGTWEWPEETLGDNTYFVSGDNRQVSQQFRIQRQQILGKLLRFWN